MALALVETHYQSVRYEKTDYVVPWNVLKTYKINDKTISEDTLTCLVGYLKSVRKCKIGYTETNEKVRVVNSNTKLDLIQ